MKFTGERMILGETDKELEIEHLDRYLFASQLAEGKTVLDAACGTGYGSAILADTAKSVTGLDISPEAIAYANGKYGSQRISFFEASVTELPFEKETFDLAVSFETLEHIDENAQNLFLQELSRVLKPDGLLIMSTPNHEVYQSRGENEFHVKELSYTEFRCLLGTKFKYVKFFSQKWEVCDTIVSDTGEEAVCANGLNAEHAEYMIAVCSNYPIENVRPHVSIRDDNRLKSLMDWAVDNHERNEQNNAHIQKLDAQIEEYERRIQAQSEAYSRQTEEVRQCFESKLLEQGKFFAEQVSALEQRQADRISALEHEHSQQISMLEREHAEQVSSIEREHAEQISALESSHAAEAAILGERLTEMKQNLLEKEAAQKAEYDALEESLKKQYADKIEAAVAERQKCLEEKTQELKEVQQTLRNKEGHIELLLESDRELERIKNSRSWRYMGYVWKTRDIVAPIGSKRRLFVKLCVKFVKHPIRFLKKCSPKRIRKFFGTLQREGVEGTSRRLDDCLIGNEIQKTPIQVKATCESCEQAKTSTDYAPLRVPAQEMPLVSIVIPVYNQFDYTYLCIKSIIENSGKVSYEILIADDCSSDLTTEIDEIVSGLNAIHNKENLRFLRNCNNAAKQARGQYILFLNNDTQVQENWLAPLVSLIESAPDIGMVGSKLVYPDGRLQEAGGILWKDGSAWNYGNRSDPDAPEFNYVKEVDYISGAAIMIKKSLWKEIGGFDDRFAPAYCEDSDLAFEVRKRGYRVLYQPKSVVVHFEGVSNGTDLSSGQKAYQVENQKKFYEKWKDVLEREHNPNAENPFLARERGINKKVLLMVDHYVPQFDKDAGSRTVYQYLQLFANKGYHVKFIGDNFYPHQPYTEVLQQMGIEVLYGPYYANHWEDWLKENGESIHYAFLNRPHIAVKYIDAVRRYTPARIVYYGHDLHFLREKREYELTGDAALLKSSEEWKKKELALMRKADMAYYPSAVEETEINQIAPDVPVKAIPAYLFTDVKDPMYHAKERKNLMFIGGFGHRPNVDAVKWLAQEVMPHLEALLPDVVVHILGSNPPREVLSLASEKLRIEGFVTDEELENYYHTCKMAIVPLRYGAGIKGKVVEAMRYGIPVVTTSVGAEGIIDAENILAVVDDSREFAEKIAELYRNPEELVQRSKASVGYIRNHFSPDNAQKVVASEFDMD